MIAVMTDTPGDSWTGSLYAANTAHHRAHDDRLITALDLRPGQRVLDIGCGVGDFTVRLADLVAGEGVANGPPGHVDGVDQSAEMIATARSSHARGDVTFHTVPAQALDTSFDDGAFDRIVSVACLHWVAAADHPGVLASCHRLLRESGRMVLDFGGRGQIGALLDIVEDFALAMDFPANPWFFPGTEYRDLVVDAGFDPDRTTVSLVEQRRSMPTFDDLCGWMDSQVLVAWKPYLDDQMWGALRAGVFQKAYTGMRRDDGTWDVDYVRCNVVAAR